MMQTLAMTTGFLHPGAMGASLAAHCAGGRVWVGRGRSAATRQRASAAGMEELSSIRELIAQADVIVSVCPPGEALHVADGVANAGFDGIYVDANAIAPATARKIAARFNRFVDGGIIGPPVASGGATRLYLSGEHAQQVAALWNDTPLDVRVIHGGAGQASALKSCYAAWTKQTSALLLAIRALARVEGVEGALLDEWGTSQPGLVARSQHAAVSNAPKAWRFVGEMHQIGDAFAAHDLPDGFSRAAAEIFDRLARTADAAEVDLESALDALLRSRGE